MLVENFTWHAMRQVALRESDRILDWWRGRAAGSMRPMATDSKTVEAQAALERMRQAGDVKKLEWVRSGQLISREVLARAWGLDPSALVELERRAELFSLKVEGRAYYPADIARLDMGIVMSITQMLEPWLDGAQQYVFWSRRHGALGGRTLFETLTGPLAAEGLEEVKRLAAARVGQARASAKAGMRGPESMPRIRSGMAFATFRGSTTVASPSRSSSGAA